VRSVGVPAIVAALTLGAAQGAHPQPLTERYELERRAGRFDLPGRLDEVSGLGFTDDGRLFAHGDERARIHEIDLAEESGGKRFSLGDPAVQGDFEGLEIIGERFFLITSTGFLYETREGAEDRAEMSFRAVDTRLGSQCEAEGLAYDALNNELLVACKRTSLGDDVAVVHRLPVEPGRRRPDPLIIPTRQLETLGLGGELHPSGIAVDPESGNLVIVAAREELLVEVDREGAIVSAFQLSRNRHPQPEGIAFGPGGVLYIADEAAGRENSRITFYARRADPAEGAEGAP
jgi:uncharacterized protein YjiK